METTRGYRRKPDFRRGSRAAAPGWLKGLAITAVAMAAITVAGAALMDGAGQHRAKAGAAPHEVKTPGSSATQTPSSTPVYVTNLTESCTWQVTAPKADPPDSGRTTQAATLRLTTNRGDIVVRLNPGPKCALTSVAHLAAAGLFRGAPCARPGGAPAFRCVPVRDPGYTFAVSSDAPPSGPPRAGDALMNGAGELLLFYRDSGSPPALFGSLGTLESVDLLRAAAQPGAAPLVIESVALVGVSRS